MKTTNALFAILGALVLGGTLAAVGCDDSGNTNTDMTVQRDLTASTVDMAGQSAQPDLAPLPPDMGCYANPTAHVQIINACTTAKTIDKKPVLPLLNADGTLPPLP